MSRDIGHAPPVSAASRWRRVACLMVHGSIRSLPTGSVTFLFTDVEGSTRLLRAQGKAYAGLLERHGAILSGAASEGAVFGAASDALFVAFDEAAVVLRAAGRAQQPIGNA